MRVLRWLTAGESHGPALTGILDGMPAGVPLTASYIDGQLERRQRGHGRGARMKIERDRVEILGGVRRGLTMGSPVSLLVRNRDFKNWKDVMAVEDGRGRKVPRVTVPRPGHADYQGAVKYGHRDMRDVLERASARETAMRVAIAGVARRLLDEFDIRIASRVVSIGKHVDATDPSGMPWEEWRARADDSPLRCLGKKAERGMRAAVDAARKAGDSLGGVFEVLVQGLPVGLGSYAQWDRRIEGALAKAFMSLNGVKGVEIGLGFEAARLPGSKVHDELSWAPDKTHALRSSNRSGGIDGGVTTGQVLAVRAAMKPIATLKKPLGSVDLETGKAAEAHVERADVCAVPAAAVIGESLAALELADAFLLKFGGDSLEEIRAHHEKSQKA